jgi:hypothetical protein
MSVKLATNDKETNRQMAIGVGKGTIICLRAAAKGESVSLSDFCYQASIGLSNEAESEVMEFFKDHPVRLTDALIKDVMEENLEKIVNAVNQGLNYTEFKPPITAEEIKVD